MPSWIFIARCDDNFLERQRDHQGRDEPDRCRPRRTPLFHAWARQLEASGGSAPATRQPALPASAARPPISARLRKTSSATSSPHDIRAQGVHYQTRPEGTPAADRPLDDLRDAGRRAFDEHLSRRLRRTRPGTCRRAEVVAEAKVTYFEGYLWDPPRAKEAIRESARIAHEHGREVSMTLSDPFCVGRYRAEFLDLMRSGTVDIVFANKQEAAVALRDGRFRTGARRRFRKDCKLAAVTLSEEGAIVIRTATNAWYDRGRSDQGTGRYDRRRRPLRGRLPVRLYPGIVRSRIAASSAALRPPSCIQRIGPRPMASLTEAAKKQGLALRPRRKELI